MTRSLKRRAKKPRGVLLRSAAQNLARENHFRGGAVRNIFCDCGVRFLERLTQETTMPFSMPSYFLGVGTVVGALTLGFGGGVLLTKTAIKEPAGPSKIERAARAEPTPAAPAVTEAKAVPVPRADPAPAVASGPAPAPQVQAAAEPAPQVQAAAPAPQVEAAVEPAKPALDVKRDEPRAAGPAKQAEPVKPAEAPKQAEQKEPERSMSAREPRRAEREQRRMERRAQRERYYAERKTRATEFVRIRQQPPEEREQPARPALAFEREEPRPNLFEGLFGRPQDAAPGEGRE
jgi:hypothetical protein